MHTVTTYIAPARRPGRLLAMAATVLLPVVGAFAQQTSVEDLVTKNEISTADRATIKSSVEAARAGLAGGPVEIKKSRDTLVAPLEKSGVTVPFRIAYGQALLESGELARLVKSENDLVAANALRIAGQAATGNTLGVVLDGLKDARPQVRLAAAVAARAAFTAARNNPAITEAELAAALRELAKVVTDDKADGPAEGALQAMVTAREFPGFRSRALQAFCDAAGTRLMTAVKSGKETDFAPYLRVAAAVQQEALEAGTLTADARKAGTLFAAQVLIGVDAAWKDGDPTPAMKTTAKAAASIASLLAGSDAAVGDLVAPGKQAKFKEALKKLLTDLQGSPASLPADKLKP